MTIKLKQTLTVFLWGVFALTSLLLFLANHNFPKGPQYATGDYVCQNDDRGPCGEEYKEDVSKLDVPGWVKFFKQSEGQLLWMGSLLAAIVIPSLADKDRSNA